MADERGRASVRRISVAAVAALAVLAAAAWLLSDRGGDAPNDSRPSADSRDATGPVEPAGATIEQDAEAVAAAIRSAEAPWSEHVADVRILTVLRRPVIEVLTGLSAENAGQIEALSTGLGETLAGLAGPDALPRTYYLRILSAEGEIARVLSFTDARWTLDAPPPPADGQGLLGWLSAVYGPASPAPEDWHGSILGVREPQTDPEGYLVIETALDPAAPGDLTAAQTIIDAVNSSGASFAPGIRVLFAEPGFEWTSLMTGSDPYEPRSP